MINLPFRPLEVRMKSIRLGAPEVKYADHSFNLNQSILIQALHGPCITTKRWRGQDSRELMDSLQMNWLIRSIPRDWSNGCHRIRDFYYTWWVHPYILHFLNGALTPWSAIILTFSLRPTIRFRPLFLSTSDGNLVPPSLESNDRFDLSSVACFQTSLRECPIFFNWSCVWYGWCIFSPLDTI